MAISLLTRERKSHKLSLLIFMINDQVIGVRLTRKITIDNLRLKQSPI